MNPNFYIRIAEALSGAILKSYRSAFASTNKLMLNFDDRSPYRIDYNLYDIRSLLNFRVEAFTVAGIGNYQLEEKLKNLALELQTDTNIADPVKEFGKLGRELIAQYVPAADVPPEGWLRTNMRTAVNSSMSAAQYSKMTDDSAKVIYPYWQYMTVGDDKVRDEHAQLHERIYLNNDPVWSVIYPPNGWNCRCYVTPVKQDELDGKTVEQVRTEKQAMKDFAKDVDPDFRRNSGEAGSIWQKWINSALLEVDTDAIYNMMTDYAGAFKQGTQVINKSELKYIKDTIGLFSRTVVKDFGNFPAMVSADPERLKVIDDIIRTPDEVWGKRTGSGNTMQYIKFQKDGIAVVKVVDGEVADIFSASMDKLNQYRDGNLIKKDFGK